MKKTCWSKPLYAPPPAPKPLPPPNTTNLWAYDKVIWNVTNNADDFTQSVIRMHDEAMLERDTWFMSEEQKRTKIAIAITNGLRNKTRENWICIVGLGLTYSAPDQIVVSMNINGLNVCLIKQQQ